MIERENRDGVVVLRIDHGKVNAIDLELLESVRETASELSSERPLGVVLTGTGRNFSAGLNLVRLLEEDDHYLHKLLPALNDALVGLFTLPAPVVAAVNGHAIAGGFVLACACDFRIVTDGKAKLGVTELPVGVPFPAAPLEMVRNVVGTRRARRLMFGGDLYSAEDGLTLGFTDEIAPADELLDRAVEVARHWGQAPADAFALTKLQLQEPVVQRLQERGPAIDSEVARVWGDPGTQAAIQAFIARTLGK